jgi:hypothetical protein
VNWDKNSASYKLFLANIAKEKRRIRKVLQQTSKSEVEDAEQRVLKQELAELDQGKPAGE